MADTVLWDQGVAYDLTHVHSPDFATRVSWALRTGLQASIKMQALGRLVSVLITGKARKVTFYTSLSDIGANLKAETSAAGLAMWIDGISGKPQDFVGSPEQRTDLRIYLAPSSFLQSALEYTWHELLHLTVPFTHGQEAAIGVKPISGADNNRWYPLMAQIGNELPAEGVDPISGERVTFQRPFASLGCRCGLT